MTISKSSMSPLTRFVYANDRYKMACQWFALPKLFKASKNGRYEVFRNDAGESFFVHLTTDLIQFKNEQSWTFYVIPKTAVINAIVSLSLDPDTIDSDFIQIKYHKDQADDQDYSHKGFGFLFKKFQTDTVPKLMSSKETEYFKADSNGTKVEVRKYKDGTDQAPKQDFTT